MTEKKRVIGIGGIFFLSENPEKLKAWYKTHLGLDIDQYGSVFSWKKMGQENRNTWIQWSVFPHDTDYLAPSNERYMINYVVDDLEWLATELKEEGVVILDEITTFQDIGKFLHIMDPEGNKIELWEPL